MGDSSPTPGSAGADAKTIDFDRGIPFLVAALGNKLSAIASNDVRRELGVGLMEWRILALLAVEKDATPARVGQVAGVDKSVVSRAATSLERRGMITIAPETSASRQTRFHMTPEGAAAHARGVSRAYANNEALLHGFTPEEREKLAELLRRATANLPRLEPKPKS
jgi:DNA-binding MarR family transcriptional regulator